MKSAKNKNKKYSAKNGLRYTDDTIWKIFEKDKKEQGFAIEKNTISLNLTELKKARARGGFTIGQLVHEAAIKDWTALTFDDITGSPYRALASRKDADISTEIAPGIKLNMPLVSANMECVTGPELAIVMAQMGGIGILHQFCSTQEQAENVLSVKKTEVKKVNVDGITYEPALDKHKRYLVGAAIGVKEENLKRAQKLIESGVDVLVIDIAHGHSDQMIEIIKKIKKEFPKIPIVAGNVVTPKGAYELCVSGADVLKVGVGPGAACTTRLVTGYGVPQITAIYEVSAIAKKFGVKVMADGGIRDSGDMVKALAAGADTLMIGRLLAPTSASNSFIGRIKEFDDKKRPKLIEYYGSASETSKKKQGRTYSDIPEGRTTLLEYAGDARLILARLITGMQSGISYAGNSRNTKKEEFANIGRLKKKSRWIRQTASGIFEGRKGNFN